MRKIKFRVWDKERKVMVYSSKEDKSNWEAWGNPLEVVNNTIESMTEEYEWLQYTGLKDKNEKEIYEGDIVKFFEYKVINKIVLPEEIVIINDIRVGCDTLRPSQYMEVIGNIYENPELLEK